MQNESKLCKDFWDTINNPKKVNINLLTDDDIETYTIGERKDVIMVIYVPMAKREQKPVYINNDIFNGTFRRNYEGDYHCTRLQVKAMLRDQTERTMDMEILDKVPMEDLNYDTIHGYRNSHRTLKEGHPLKDVIMVIYVPMAKREQKPIYINNDIFNGTFRRNYEGDYHCCRLQVKAMLRVQTERKMYMEI